MRVARIVGGLDREDARIQVLPKLELGFVERLIDTGANLAAEKVRRCADDIVTGLARQQSGIHGLVGVVNVVDDLDAGALLEFVDRVAADEVGPIVDVEPFLLCAGMA